MKDMTNAEIERWMLGSCTSAWEQFEAGIRTEEEYLEADGAHRNLVKAGFEAGYMLALRRVSQHILNVGAGAPIVALVNDLFGANKE